MEDTTPKFLESVTEHPDVQRLCKQIIRSDIKNKELQAENAKLKEIIKRFVDIAEALKGGCWE